MAVVVSCLGGQGSAAVVDAVAVAALAQTRDNGMAKVEKIT